MQLVVLLTLAFIAFFFGFAAYAGLKTGVITDQFGRAVARREGRSLIFWTLWSILALACLGSTGCLMVLASLMLFG